MSLDSNGKLLDTSGGFPLTRHSAIVALKSEVSCERRIAMGRIIESYWMPIYKYLRLRWHKERPEAEDLTQGFFLSALEQEFLADFDAGKARFRTFLRVCLDRYVGKESAAASRQKRGGDLQRLSLDFDFAEGEIAELPQAHAPAPDQLFEREWMRSLFVHCVELLRHQCEAAGTLKQFAVFERYDLEALDSETSTTYRELAEAFQVSEETVTNYLSAMRRDFRRIVLAEIRDLTATDEEYREEVRAMLGVDTP